MRTSQIICKLGSAILLLFLSTGAEAQFIERLGKKAQKAAERTVERRVENEASKKTDKALDEVLEGDGKSSKKEKKEKTSSSKEEKSESSNSKKEKSASSGSKEESSTSAGSKSSSNIVTGSQFFPDGALLFNENFSKDAQGDFPANWNTNSGGEVILVNGEKALRFYPNGRYIVKTGALPENYALEFDLITENLDSKGLAGSRFGLDFTDEQSLDRPKSAARFGFSLWKASTTCNQLLVESFGKVSNKMNNHIPFKMQDKFNTSTHFTMVVNGSRLRVYINNDKTIDLPSFLSDNLARYIQFYLRGTDMNEKHVVAIANIKITEEGNDIRSQILKGRFTTNKILFASGSDEIESASFTILNDVADAIKSGNATFKIIGHTDSDGDEDKNLELSRKRAESVKKYLASKGISSSMLITEGKGEADPVASNNTAEGKAQNRRVEFIKN